MHCFSCGNSEPTLCPICGHKQEPHAPDNKTLVPCCKTCWGKMTPALRLQGISNAQQAAAMDQMASMWNGFVEGRAAELARQATQRRQTRYEEN